MTLSNLLEMVETACPYYSNNKNLLLYWDMKAGNR